MKLVRNELRTTRQICMHINLNLKIHTHAHVQREREGEGDHLNFILVRKSFAFVSRFSGNYSSRKTALLATTTTMTAMMTNTDFLHAMPCHFCSMHPTHDGFFFSCVLLFSNLFLNRSDGI